MIIYVVTSGQYSDYRIEGLFSTKEKAEAFALLVKKANDIEEYSIDERVEDVVGPIWGVWISLKTGVAPRSPWLSSTRARNPRFTETEIGANGPDDAIIRVESAVSGEHALKVAAETRQNMLREAALDQDQSVDPA